MLKNDYIKDYNSFVALMNKFFDDEILKEKDGNKIILKSHSLINKTNFEHYCSCPINGFNLFEFHKDQFYAKCFK